MDGTSTLWLKKAQVESNVALRYFLNNSDNIFCAENVPDATFIIW